MKKQHLHILTIVLLGFLAIFLTGGELQGANEKPVLRITYDPAVYAYDLQDANPYDYPSLYYVLVMDPIYQALTGLDLTLYKDREFNYTNTASSTPDPSFSGTGTIRMSGKLDYQGGQLVSGFKVKLSYSSTVTFEDERAIKTITTESTGTGTFTFDSTLPEGDREVILDYGRSFMNVDRHYYRIESQEINDDGSLGEVTVTESDSDGYIKSNLYMTFKGIPLEGMTAAVPPSEDGSFVVDTDASEDPGTEMAAGIPDGVFKAAVAVAGAAAALGMAGLGALSGGKSPFSGNQIEEDAGGDDQDRKEEDEKQARFRMYLYKEFGDTLEQGRDYLLYVRIAQEDEGGKETDRSDMTGEVNIISEDGSLTFDGPPFFTSRKGRSYLCVKARLSKDYAGTQAVASFLYQGEGGTFRNNLLFKLAGNPRIELEKKTIRIQSWSGKSWTCWYKFIDFPQDTKHEIETMNLQGAESAEEAFGPGNIQAGRFQVEDGFDEEKRPAIIVKEVGEKGPFDRFEERYEGSLIAYPEIRDLDMLAEKFEILRCNEGPLPDYGGKEYGLEPGQLRCFRADPESDSKVLADTTFGLKLGIWNEGAQALEYVTPETASLAFSDSRKVCENLKLASTYDPGTALVTVKAEDIFVGESPYEITADILASYQGKAYDNQVRMSLLPDKVRLQADFDEELNRLFKDLRFCMPPDFALKKMEELKTALPYLGLKDLQTFRMEALRTAQSLLLEEYKSYMAEVAWYDKKIGQLELVVLLTEVFFEAGLMALAGPMTTFLIKQVKQSIVDAAVLLTTAPPNKSAADLLLDFGSSRLIQTAGNVDDAIPIPGKDNKALLAAWIGSYAVYRFGYHLTFSKDEKGRGNGITGALEKMVLDVCGKSAQILMKDYLETVAKSQGFDFSERMAREQEAVNKAIGKSLDALDKAAPVADEALEKGLEILKRESGDYLGWLARSLDEFIEAVRIKGS